MAANTCTSTQAPAAELGMGPAAVAGASVTMSERAAQHIANFLAKRGKGLGIKLGVRTSGCSGMAYKLEFVDVEDPDDVKFVCRGVVVYVDPKSLSYLNGTELDYVREGLNEGFKFNNPNVKSSCGCGESFNV
jgi:iron-sulfur cluster assembly protein